MCLIGSNCRRSIKSKIKGFQDVDFYIFCNFFFAGSVLLAYMLATEAVPWGGVAIITFFIGLFFIMVSPAMLITPERAIELRGREIKS